MEIKRHKNGPGNIEEQSDIRLSIQLYQLKQCGTGVKTDKQINRIEIEIEQKSHMYMVT